VSGGSSVTGVRRAVTGVAFVIAGLAFAFGFGNGWQLGLALGVPDWIAPLVAPAVDLSVVTLLATIQYLRTHGADDRLVGPRLLLIACGLVTCALNTVRPLLDDQLGRACFDAVAPLLLIGWSEIGPRLLGLLYGLAVDHPIAVPDGPGPSVVVPDEQPGLPIELVAQARQLAAEHHEATGRRITRDRLRAGLRVSNEVAGMLLRQIRDMPETTRSGTLTSSIPQHKKLDLHSYVQHN
jgi:hypothetical protein